MPLGFCVAGSLDTLFQTEPEGSPGAPRLLRATEVTVVMTDGMILSSLGAPPSLLQGAVALLLNTTMDLAGIMLSEISQ